MTMTKDDLRRVAREMNEIIFAAPLPRMRDENGGEWVDRDALAVAVRQFMERRIHLTGSKHE
jgi:hypothetical protein